MSGENCLIESITAIVSSHPHNVITTSRHRDVRRTKKSGAEQVSMQRSLLLGIPYLYCAFMEIKLLFGEQAYDTMSMAAVQATVKQA